MPRWPTSSTASPSCRASPPTATSSNRPRTSARCCSRWRRTSGSSSSSSPTASTTCARCTACRPRSSSASRARRWRSTPRWPSASGSGRSSGSSRTSRSRCSSPSASASWRSCSTRGARAARPTSTGPSPSSGRDSRRPASRPTCRADRSTSSASGRRCSARARSSARSTTSTPSASWSTRCATATPRSASCTACGGPIPGQFDDYIAVPKNNLYQSLHTAVIALDGKPLEIQIRTHQMHQVSEVGIAAHWRYKEGTKSDREYDAKLAWLRQLMDWQRDVSESDATEFVEGIKLDIFQDQVFVFTPKGDIKDLPAGATPLDFAYRIHTDVGHRTIGAKVNNRLVPLDYRLKNGDIVEIVTTKGEHGPSRDWLNVVRTSHAREKIRQWFKRKDRDENIVHGREALERELRRLARTTHLGGRHGQDRRGRQAAEPRLGRRLLRGDRLRRDRRRRPSSCASASSTTARASSRPSRPLPAARAHRRCPGQGRRRPARPLRQVLPPDPGRPDRRLHHPRQGRDRPSPLVHDRVQRARGQPARSRSSGRPSRPRRTRSPSASRPTTGPGCSTTSPRSWPRTRSTSSPPTSA